MHIESVELRLIEMPLLAPFTASFGTQTLRPILLITVRAEGLEGYGECVALKDPYYSYETPITAEHIIRTYLLPLLFSADLRDPDDVWALFGPIRGHNMAKAAVEMAVWDLWARSMATPLSSLYAEREGRARRDRVAVGVSIGIEPTPAALVERVAGFVEAGYARIKLKIGPGHDVAHVHATRATFPNVLMQVDANSAYTLADIPVFQAMDDLNLLLIEQPLGPDDIVDHAALQRELVTPVCLDESIHSPDDARHALDLDSCRVINIKPGRVGGARQTRAIHDICLARDIPVWCGGMFETNIGRAHNVALASMPAFSLPGDISASSRYYARDIALPNFELHEDSTLTVPTGPGIGVELDREALNAVTLRAESISYRQGVRM